MLIAVLPRWQGGKESACQCRRRWRLGFDPWVGMIPWRRRKWQRTPVFLPGKPHRQRSRAGHSPWAHRESDATEHRQTPTFSASPTPSLLYLYCFQRERVFCASLSQISVLSQIFLPPKHSEFPCRSPQCIK